MLLLRKKSVIGTILAIILLVGSPIGVLAENVVDTDREVLNVESEIESEPVAEYELTEETEPVEETDPAEESEAEDETGSGEESETEDETGSGEEPGTGDETGSTEDPGTEEGTDSEAEDEIQEPDPIKIKTCKIELSEKTFVYSGKEKKPTVTVKDGSKQLKKGKDYTVAYENNINVGTAKAIITGIGSYVGTVSKTYKIKYGSPTLTYSSSYSKIKIKWKKVAGATGYKIYRSRKKSSGFKLIKKITSGSKVSYIDKKPKFNKTYYYKIRIYHKEEIKEKGKTKTKTTYGPYSEVMGAKKKLSAVVISSANSVTTTSVRIKWKNVAKAQGYHVYYSREKDGPYKYAGKTRAGFWRTYTVKKLKKGVRYYFKVKAYRKLGSKKVYGVSSKPKRENISLQHRLDFLFPKGLPNKKAEMEKYLVTITVPIVDVNGIEGTKELRVHKSLAEDFIAAFKEMYKIGFPVRAEDTDTYNWRSMSTAKNRSHHSYGCVVDINWDSNPMIGVTEGKYKPGKDPYSVTKEVVNIWKKHGFYWGGNWNTTKDYMHFSYTNH